MITTLFKNCTLFLFWQLAFEFMFTANVIVDALIIYGMVKAYQKYDEWVQKHERKGGSRRRHGYQPKAGTMPSKAPRGGSDIK